MPLTDNQLRQYLDDGYLLVRSLFSRDYIDRLADECDGLHERMHTAAPSNVHVSWEEGLEDGRPPRIRQLLHSERVSQMIDEISRSDEVLSIMRQLIGPDIWLFHSKLMMKAAHDGTFTPWHQDWGYWKTMCKTPTQVNCMLAIDPATEENGAIRFVPGSHLQGPIDHKNFASKSFSIGLDGDIDAFPSRLCTMEPGDAVFFGPMVVHGSAPNKSPHDRRANTMAFDKADNMLTKPLPPQNHRRGREVAIPAGATFWS